MYKIKMYKPCVTFIHSELFPGNQIVSQSLMDFVHFEGVML